MNFYTFFPRLLNMSLTGSVAIICVLLLRLLLQKAPKVISYALWAVVLFRLLCPVSVSSAFSLFGMLNAPTAETVVGTSSIRYVSEEPVHMEYPRVELPHTGLEDAINSGLPVGREQLSADPLEALVSIGTYIWFLGVLVMAVYSGVSYVRLKKKLLIVTPLRENIYLADEIRTPFVMGLLCPKIYLPSDTEEHQLPYIILHEKHHIRRGDHILKALAFLAVVIHWFNPLVWVAFVCAGRDMEMSCDEAVVNKLGKEVLADYTAALLSLATGKTIIAGVPLAFGEGDTGGRIKNLAQWKKPAMLVVLAAVIACCFLAAALLTNPKPEKEADYREDGYHLLIGAEGVMSIEVSSPGVSGGIVCADGSPFRVGEKVWLEQLQRVTILRGVTITALGEEGEILYELAIPEDASEEVISEIVGSDPWFLLPTSFEIQEGEEQVAVKWTFSPMMSAVRHAAFHFDFKVEHYSYIEATCDNGMLTKSSEGGRLMEKAMQFEQGEPLCWIPVTEGGALTDTEEEAKITFTVFEGKEIVDSGVLNIIRTGTEDGQSFYEAQLTDTELFVLFQEEGSPETSIAMAGNGAVVSYTDLNRNRIAERIVVREVEPDMVYELLVVENGRVIRTLEAGLPHVGWNTILCYEEEGKSYLVEYQPTMYQGVGNYRCKVYSLENDNETIKQEWAVDFELFHGEGLIMEPTSEMQQFAGEVGILLRNSTVLLSTEQGILVRDFAYATDLPQIYPVRFDPDEIWAAIDGTGSIRELTSEALDFPKEPLELLFASGAGGWGSRLVLNPDGSFTGDYQDTEMGSRTEEYPNGTCYVSVFEGRFTEINQICDYAWSMKLADLKTKREPEETWIEEGIRYIASQAHGISGGETFVLYGPGTPADELPGDCRSWWPNAYDWRMGEMENLQGWALCNRELGVGFFSD